MTYNSMAMKVDQKGAGNHCSPDDPGIAAGPSHL